VIAAANPDIFTGGIYTLAEAAHIARLRPQTVINWYDQSPTRGPAVTASLPVLDGDRAVSFVELIQLMAIRSIRADHKISLQKIRQSVAKASEAGYKWPLAQEAIKLYRFDSELVFGLPDGTYIQASGTLAKHYLMEQVILPYLEGIRFGDDKLPSQYRPPGFDSVVLNPNQRWGAPMIEGSGYTVAALVNTAHSEGSVTAAARMCGVTEEQILAAVRFEDYLRGVAA
jgi:uncharacterized protein (DUF433 family)